MKVKLKRLRWRRKATHINYNKDGEMENLTGKEGVAVKIERSAHGVSPKKEVVPSSMVFKGEKGKLGEAKNLWRKSMSSNHDQGGEMTNFSGKEVAVVKIEKTFETDTLKLLRTCRSTFISTAPMLEDAEKQRYDPEDLVDEYENTVIEFQRVQIKGPIRKMLEALNLALKLKLKVYKMVRMAALSYLQIQCNPNPTILIPARILFAPAESWIRAKVGSPKKCDVEYETEASSSTSLATAIPHAIVSKHRWSNVFDWFKNRGLGQRRRSLALN